MALMARCAIGEVLGRRRIDEIAGARRQVALEEALVLKVVLMPGEDHGLPLNNPRSLRAARNKWTRTVDSFKPVMALISRGV